MNNVSSNSCRHFHDYRHIVDELSLENYLMPIFLALTSLVGIAGNCTVIFIVLFKPGMRTIQNLFIVNLSFGDMVFICGHMWFAIPSYLLGQFYAGPLLCRLMTFIKLTTLGVSVFTLTFMAMDRCRAITMPLHQHVLSTISVVSIMVTIWVFSCAVSIPSTVMSRVEDHTHNFNQTCIRFLLCTNVHEYFRLSTWIKFFLYFVFPFLIISICYITIFVTLYKSQNGPSLVVSNSVNASVTILNRQISARKRLSVVVLALVAIFVICRLPHESHSIHVVIQNESIYLWTSVATILLCIYSFINPLILYILSPTFRRFMVRIWCSHLTSLTTSMPKPTVPISVTQVLYSRGSRNASR